MELFDEKRSDVDKLVADIRERPCFAEPVDKDHRRDRHVGPCQGEYVQDIADAAVSHHRHQTQCHLAVRAGFLTAGQRACNFLGYSEIGAVRRTGNEAGRVPVPS
jgi:hypothetical protein